MRIYVEYWIQNERKKARKDYSGTGRSGTHSYQLEKDRETFNSLLFCFPRKKLHAADMIVVVAYSPLLLFLRHLRFLRGILWRRI